MECPAAVAITCLQESSKTALECCRHSFPEGAGLEPHRIGPDINPELTVQPDLS
jgi:hypothetical protein